MDDRTSENIKSDVRKNYGAVARGDKRSCCESTSSCCSGSDEKDQARVNEFITTYASDPQNVAKKLGYPPLGYDFDANEKGKLVVNDKEKNLVRLIFETYKKEASYMRVANTLNKKGFKPKSYVTKSGNKRGGRKFSNTSIQTILRNPVYIGQIEYDGNLYNGKHPAIVGKGLFKQIQSIIDRNSCSNRNIKVSPSRAL